MSENKPTVISLFAGCGGSSLGYKMAGFNVLYSIDYDANCEKVYRQNFTTGFERASVIGYDWAALMKNLCLKPGELDILDGSPPCQGFSMCGHRKTTDNRNYLYQSYLAALKSLMPKGFIIENVPGMAQGIMKTFFLDLFKQAIDLGYNVRANILNAADYGVPQSRKRLIILGIRSDLKRQPVFPKKMPKQISLDGIKPGIAGSPNVLTGRIITLLKLAKPGQSADKVKDNYAFNYIKLNPLKPAPTLITQSKITDPTCTRHLYLDEIKWLQSFPLDFKFENMSDAAICKMIGNSVPPLLMKAIASTMRQQIT